MPPRPSGTLTEAELRIMDVLWRKGSGTVQQVLDSIVQEPALAYNSVLTTIRILERKGYLKHLKDGRAHVYTPLVGQKEATRSEIRHLVSRFFKNSHEQLVLNLLEDQGIGAEEIGRLREMLDQHDMAQHDMVQHDMVQRGTLQSDMLQSDKVQDKVQKDTIQKDAK